MHSMDLAINYVRSVWDRPVWQKYWLRGNEKYEKQLQAEILYRVSVGCPEEVCSFDRLTRYVEDLGETKALLDAIREGAPETPMLFVMTYAENKTSGLHSQDIMVRLFGRS